MVRETPTDPGEELEQLRARVDDLQAFKDGVERGRATEIYRRRWLAVFLGKALVGRQLASAIRAWRRARVPGQDPLPEPESSNLAAGIVHRFVRLSFFGLFAALVPFSVSIIAVVLSGQANQKLGTQNELVAAQNDFFQRQIREQAEQSQEQIDLQIDLDYHSRKASLIGVIFSRTHDGEKTCPPPAILPCWDAYSRERCPPMPPPCDGTVKVYPLVAAERARQEAVLSLLALERTRNESTATSVQREGSEPVRVDLAYSDLRGLRFPDADFSGAILVGADLSRTEFSGADLRGADLSGANLSEARMVDVYLDDADLSGADLSEAVLSDAILLGADFSEANLVGARIDGARFGDTDLWNANLANTTLNGANLSDTYFTGVMLWDANLWGANLTGVNLAGGSYNDGTVWPKNFDPTDPAHGLTRHLDEAPADAASVGQ